ncbi:MAG: hypothetical protein JOZ99_11350 [Actinobacteria bacterium]|nr:hypothetical protein [Actinomycetota bacterium]
MEPEATEAEDLVEAWRGVLDASTVAWLDQRAARLAEEVALSILLAAWHEDDVILEDVDVDDEIVLGRLVVAMAIITKARPVRIEIG